MPDHVLLCEEPAGAIHFPATVCRLYPSDSRRRHDSVNCTRPGGARNSLDAFGHPTLSSSCAETGRCALEVGRCGKRTSSSPARSPSSPARRRRPGSGVGPTPVGPGADRGLRAGRGSRSSPRARRRRRRRRAAALPVPGAGSMRISGGKPVGDSVAAWTVAPGNSAFGADAGAALSVVAGRGCVGHGCRWLHDGCRRGLNVPGHRRRHRAGRPEKFSLFAVKIPGRRRAPRRLPLANRTTGPRPEQAVWHPRGEALVAESLLDQRQRRPVQGERTPQWRRDPAPRC